MLRHAFLATAIIGAATGSLSGQDRPLVGKVIAISDGDTIAVLDSSNMRHRVRLEGIDAPEAVQPFGTKSGDTLGDKVFGQQVRIEWSKRDRYGRILGHVYLGERWINREQVAEGLAWHFKKYSTDKELAEAEVSARDKRLGLWAESNATPPWEWRRPMPATK